jgi:DNA repair protein RecN (Recombination protein N)
MMAAESIAAALDEAAKALSENGRTVEQALAAAERALERVQDSAAGALDAAAGALERARIEAGEAGAQLDAAAAALDAEPGRLEQVEERLFSLRAAARRHDCAVDALPETRDALAARLAALDAGEASLASQREAVAAARADFVAAAKTLGERRAKAARRLDKAVSGELGALHLGKASFATALEPLEEDRWGPAGAERVLFRIATNPGQPAAPLSDIASGGELSRFMLALCVALSATLGTSSLVFDEIDSGVGGAVADAVGKRLATVAAASQVLVVTHQPQVAARADCHFRVAKKTRKGSTATGVETLAQGERREEIARMLAGAEITESARAAADALIEGDGA